MNSTPPSGRASSGRSRTKYKIHWHVALIHFPISFFLGAFIFMALHLLTGNSCYASGAYISLVTGTVFLLPATLTGWMTWKRTYRGIKGKLFLNKIRISYGMLALSIALVIFQTIFPFHVLEAFHSVRHFLYFSGVTLLMLGAIAEGYYGGRLHHR